MILGVPEGNSREARLGVEATRRQVRALSQHHDAKLVSPRTSKELKPASPRAIGLHPLDVVMEGLHALPMVINTVPELGVALRVLGHMSTGLRPYDRRSGARQRRVKRLQRVRNAAVEAVAVARNSVKLGALRRAAHANNTGGFLGGGLGAARLGRSTLLRSSARGHRPVSVLKGVLAVSKRGSGADGFPSTVLGGPRGGRKHPKADLGAAVVSDKLVGIRGVERASPDPPRAKVATNLSPQHLDVSERGLLTDKELHILIRPGGGSVSDAPLAASWLASLGLVTKPKLALPQNEAVSRAECKETGACFLPILAVRAYAR